MAEIIEFPKKPGQAWVYVEKSIRFLLQDNNAPEDMTEELCKKMKTVFEGYTRDISTSAEIPTPALASQAEIDALTSAINDFATEIQGKIHELIGKVLVDRLALEIKLYKHDKD